MKLFLSLLFVVCATTACGKKNGNSNNFGPEAKYADIQDIQQKITKKSDPNTLQKGDFVYLLKTQEVYTDSHPSAVLMEEEGITVADREEDGDYSIITILRELVDHSDPKDPVFKFKDVYYLAKNPKPEDQNQDDNSNVEPTYPGVTLTYHNLRTTEIRLPRPEAVEQRNPCAADKDCSLGATRMEYDVVVHTDGKPSRRNHFEVVFSTDLPFFGHVVKNCITSLASVEDLRPLVRQCTIVNDYQYGNSPAQ